MPLFVRESSCIRACILHVFPYLRKEADDVNYSDLPFSVHFDETKTAQVKKQMDLTLRYWSPTRSEVIVTFYTSLFFGHAEADKVMSRMIEQFHEENSPVDKLITLVRDGPNVNKAIIRKIELTIEDEHPEFKGFVDLGSCVLHVVHNGFGKGLEMYDKGIDQLCFHLHAIFTYSAARREDYQQLQANLKADIETFQQHTKVLWLSIGPAIHRVLEQWDTIYHFIKDLEKDNTRKSKSINFKRAAALLATGERNVTRVMLEFLRSTAPLSLKSSKLCLQTSGPSVHVVYDAMRLTLLKLMRRFVQADQLKDVHGSALQSVSCEGIKDQLPDGELVIGDNTRKYLALLKPDKQKAALLGMRAFFGGSRITLTSQITS